MNKSLNFIILVLCLTFIGILYFLPDILFTNNLASQKTYHDTLQLNQDNSVEDLLISSKSIKTTSDSSTTDIHIVETQHKELVTLLEKIGLNSNIVVIKNSTVKVVSSTIYWQIDFFDDNGYGNLLLENKTNKILQFNYFSENSIENLNSEKIITEYFKYLDIPLQPIIKKNRDVFETQLSSGKELRSIIDNYRILLNISDENA